MTERDEAAIEDRIDRAIGRLDLPTKVTLLTGASMFSLHGEPSIGLQPMVFSDGPNGVRGTEFVGGRQVALLPNATLLAQSWDETAAQRAGELLAGEALAQGVHVVLGADGQPAPHPAQRPAVRVLRRGPAAQRAAGGGVRPRAAALRRRRPPSSTTWPTSPRPTGTTSTPRCQPGRAARALPAAVRDLRRRRPPVDDHGRLQRRQRRGRDRARRAQQRRAQERVGLGRPADVGLGRDQDRGPGGGRRAGPGDARPGRAVGRCPGAAGRGRRGGRGRRSTSTYAGCSGWPAGSGRWTASPADRTAQLDAAPGSDRRRWSATRCAPGGRRAWCCSRARTCCRWTRLGDHRPRRRWCWSAMPALHTTLMGGGSASLRPPHEISIAQGLTEALGRQPGPGRRRGGRPAEPAARRARPW